MKLTLTIHTKYYHFNMVTNTKAISELFYSLFSKSGAYFILTFQTSHISRAQ